MKKELFCIMRPKKIINNRINVKMLWEEFGSIDNWFISNMSTYSLDYHAINTMITMSL